MEPKRAVAQSHGTPNDPVYWVEAFHFYYIQPDNIVTYAYLESGTNGLGETMRPMSAAEKDLVLDAIAKLTPYANISFVPGDVATADIVFGISNDADAAPTGITIYHNGRMEVIAYDNKYMDHDVSGNTYIFKHEILHAFGLDHSTAAFGQSGVVIPDTEDNGTTLYGNWPAGWLDDFQLFDIAAMQYLYGPNPSVRAGDDTYVINPGVYDPLDPEAHLTLIWDGRGYDTLDFSSFAVPISASLTPGVIGRIDGASGGILDAGTFAINYRTDIERLVGGTANDTLSGNEHNNRLEAGAGNDLLSGLFGRDFLEGAAGDDTLFGGGKRDTMTGGDGADVLAGGGKGDVMDGDALADALVGAGGNDVMSGGLGDDLMNAGSGRDQVFGDDGNDAIDSGAGDDVVDGGQGADSVFGAAANDSINGGDGDDSLNGGPGNDTLTGGAGNDVFELRATQGADTISDMTAGAGAGDVVKLVGFGAAFDTFAEVMAAATDDGTDTTITLGGDILVLQGVVVADLDADDFIFG